MPTELSLGLMVSDIVDNIRDIFWSVGGLGFNVIASNVRGTSDSQPLWMPAFPT